MCGHGEEHDHLHPPADLVALDLEARRSGGLNRRQLLQAAGALAGAAALSPRLGFLTPTAASAATVPRPTSSAGGAAYRTAMHVHASFSEGVGSTARQIGFANGAKADALFLTEHDWRIAKIAHLEAIHFDAWGESVPGGKLTWTKQVVGALSTASGAITKTTTSPNDPSAVKGAFSVKAASGSNGSLQYLCGSPRLNYRANITGLALTVDVLPQQVGTDSWLEMRVVLSNQPAGTNRPAGQLVVVYRIGGEGALPARSGATGYVNVAASKGAWSTITLRPADDVARLWPDVNAKDNTLYGLSIGAAARNGATAAGVYDYLRFGWANTGQAGYDLHRQVCAEFQAKYPSLQIIPSHEISYMQTHVNQFGGGIGPVAYPAGLGLNPPDDEALWRQIVSTAQSNGGVMSYNHPFGAAGGGPASTDQAAVLAAVVPDFLSHQLYGASVLEVGYDLRQGATLATHLDLWDVLTRNGIFVTGTGVSDSHGEAWTPYFLTTVYANALTESGLALGLAQGQAVAVKPSAFGGFLDTTMDGSVPMGGISVAAGLASRTVQVACTGLASGSVVEVRATPIDYAGPSVPAPGTTTIATLTATDLAAGLVSLTVEKGAAFGLSVRAQVRTSAGAVVGIGNPVVWLEDLPADGRPALPPARVVGDEAPAGV